MRRTIASRKGYVRRLRQMMKEKDTCECCPGAVGFDVSNFWDTSNRIKCTRQLEAWCISFVGLRVFKENAYKNKCPCFRVKDAPTRALLALEQYDAGTHPWQTNPKIDLNERLPEDE